MLTMLASPLSCRAGVAKHSVTDANDARLGRMLAPAQVDQSSGS